jgi:mannitol/fructose-specific phosphotransferase system IIA component (Ntr-type)
VLHESKLGNYRPLYHAPLYPWLQITGLLGMGFAMFELGLKAYLISALLIGVALVIFWFFGRKESRQESALLHMLERLTDRRLVTGTLEAELKEIIRERDEIVWDRFDHLVEAAIVMDVDKPMEKEEFFSTVDEKLADKLRLEPGHLAELLSQRENESSTLLGPSLAVPHVVVEGEGRFEMLIARMNGGVCFSDEAPEVKTIFVLAATRDERNFHLRVLAAIAQVAQQEDFEERWMEAKSEQGLRDVILLSKRRRA